jgi:TIR domain
MGQQGGKLARSKKDQVTVFLSHINEEAALAVVLERWIEDTFGGSAEVFVSSSPTDLPPGSRWWDRIAGALERSKVFLVLCSPVSINRPWINFEMGWGWGRHVDMIPICHSGQRKGQLPGPISQVMGLEIDDEHFAERLIDSIAKHTGFSKAPRIDYAAMTAEIRTAAGQVLRVAEVTKDQPSVPAEERYAAAFANLTPAERFVFSRFLVNNRTMENFTLDAGDPEVTRALLELEQHGYLSKVKRQHQILRYDTVLFVIDESVFEYLKAHPDLWEYPSAENRSSAASQADPSRH